MTLTQTAILTKQIINITITATVLGVIIFIGYQVWYSYYLSTLPPVEEKPDTKFGILPKPNFPESGVSSSNFSYSLDTVTGGLPKIGQESGFDKLSKVYFVIKPYSTFLSSDKSQRLAEKFNIINPPEILNENTYYFRQDNEQFKKTLAVDLDSGNFNYSKEASSAAVENLDSDNILVDDFKNTLNRLGVLREELRSGASKVILLRVEDNKFIPTQERAEAIVAQISLWPQPLDKKPIFTSDVNKSLVHASVVKSATDIENYLSLSYTFFQIDSSTYATYPTKLPEEAFTDLRNGKGVVIIEPEKPQVSITAISLGYFLPDSYTPYVLPIYVFEGPQFMAYVTAISNQFVKSD